MKKTRKTQKKGIISEPIPDPPKEVVIKEVLSRGVLYEGRNNGMAFGLLKKIQDNEYHTVNPLSPCKDYLAEVVFTERFGIPTAGCGLQYPKVNDIFTEGNLYLAIKIMPTKTGGYSYSKSIEEDIKKLESNRENIEKFMHYFDEALGLKKTIITPANDGYFLVIGDHKCAISTPAISLYTLLLRTALYYKEGNPMDFIKGNDVHQSEKYLLNGCLQKIQIILDAKKLPPQRAPKVKVNSFSPHSQGILAWDSSFEELDIKSFFIK